MHCMEKVIWPQLRQLSRNVWHSHQRGFICICMREPKSIHGPKPFRGKCIDFFKITVFTCCAEVTNASCFCLVLFFHHAPVASFKKPWISQPGPITANADHSNVKFPTSTQPIMYSSVKHEIDFISQESQQICEDFLVVSCVKAFG